MLVDGVIPAAVLTVAAAATIFVVMLTLGLGILLAEFLWVWRNPGLVVRALFAVLIAVPVLALAVVRAVELPRAVELGIVLMAIAPGAPVALRRSLGAGAHRAFAPALQISVALLAAVAMPLWIAALVALYAGEARLEPQDVAIQVFKAQLLPLGIGMLIRRLAPAWAARAEPVLAKVAGALLVLLLLLVLIEVLPLLLAADWRVIAAIVVVTLLATAVGHVLGGPEPATRTAVAISSAARNAGLALLVATVNHASSAVIATVFVYLVVSALTLVPYIAYRRRTAAAALGAVARAERSP